MTLTLRNHHPKYHVLTQSNINTNVIYQPLENEIVPDCKGLIM